MTTRWARYGDDEFCNYIIDFIDRKKDDDNPFFVYWPMALTHKPHEPSPDSPRVCRFRSADEQDAWRSDVGGVGGWRVR